MFLRKIFSSNNKFTWVVIDLIIVIIGVYGAFLIQSYAENQKNLRDQERVLTALKFELEVFRYRMSETAQGMVKEAGRLDKIQSENSYSDFSNYRFIEPQYDYQTTEYTLNLQNNDIVDFELNNVLQLLFVELKRIEHTERLLTETARKYKTIPDILDKNTIPYQLIRSENIDNFERFVILIKDRGEVASRVAAASKDALIIINDRLGDEKSREIEKTIILNNANIAGSEERAVVLCRYLFPDFSEEEIRQLYRQATSTSED